MSDPRHNRTWEEDWKAFKVMPVGWKLMAKVTGLAILTAWILNRLSSGFSQ